MLRRGPPLLLGSLLAFGCEDGAAVRPEVRATMQEKLAHLPEIAATARTHALVDEVTVFAEVPPDAWRRTKHTPVLTLGEAIEFPELVSSVFNSREYQGEQHLLWHCHDLASHDRILTKSGPCSEKGDPSECEEIVDVRAEACAALDIVLVVRFRDFLEATMKDTAYDGGYARGELLVFDLDDGRLLCAAPFEAESDDSRRSVDRLWESFVTPIRTAVDRAYDACKKEAGA